MSDIKQDVKESVKIFTQIFVSTVVKESTKKLIKSLTQTQRKMLETRVKNMSDDQLEQYFNKDPYFNNELENTVKSVNRIQPANGSGSWLENIQTVCENSCIQNLIKVLIQPVIKITFAIVACIALMAVIAVPMIINGEPDVDKILPVANFSSIITSGNAPLSVKFIDQSKNSIARNWDFGDGTNSTERNPAHTYSLAGNYTVFLTANNTNGTNSTFTIIKVLEPPVSAPGKSIFPFANFICSVTRGYTPLSVQFTDISENATGFKWDLGDGTYSTEKNPIHTYSAAGNYTVSLTATNANGTNSASAIINVLKRPVLVPGNPVLPFANFISSVNKGYVPLSVQFTDLSENATERNWDFGDGATSTEQNPVHTYSSAKNFTVNLTVSNTNGTASTSDTIYVLPAPVLPKADFSSDVTSGYVPLSVQFTDLSENETGLNWDFGDGMNSTDDSPSHTYTAAGNYTINLTAINVNGTDSKLATIAVLPLYVYVTNSNGTVSLIDASTKKIAATLPAGISPQEAAVMQDGTVYVTNSGDESENSSSVSIIDTATKTVIDELNLGSYNMLMGIAVNPTGTKVYAANAGLENTIYVIDTATRKVIDNINLENVPYKVAISRDGTKVYVTNPGDDNVSVIDTTTNTVTATVSGLSNPYGIAVNPEGTKVYVTNYGGGTVSIVDTATNTITATVNVGTNPIGVAVTPDGTKVYVSNSGDDNVSVIDTATNSVTATVSGLSNPNGVAVTPDGKEVYVANYGDGTVTVIDTVTNTVKDTVPVGNNPLGVAIIQR